MTELSPLEELRYGSLFVMPVSVPNWDQALDDDSDEYMPRWFEADPYTDDAGRKWTRIVSNSSVIALYIDGRIYRQDHDYDEYEQAHLVYLEENDDLGQLAEGALTLPDFNRLFLTRDIEAEGPMMNYWYPFEAIDDESDAVEAAAKIADLPLCVVEIDGEYGLALTGGGMDMTWEICAAFMALGQLPPVHYARDLPAMAGAGKSERDQAIIAACLKSLDGAMDQLRWARQRVAERFAEEMGADQKDDDA